ncbi:putative helicase [Tupanvirus deep ocean]|uniref:Helicase n=2 Tax=Tupanvirus TaxID=2094720 RepID=A0AC62A7G8_9VIRU|nr:putative helicase [Tupanvirus deep ocean]QKU33628.1 putative helicase [Tupanvirus deep ocean]
MDEIDYGNLIRTVEKYTKKSYQAYYRNGQLVPNLANLGGKIGEIVKRDRPGEYYGLAVQLLEDFKPLLTDRFVIRILSMLKREDYVTPLELLGLSSLDQLQYILHTWFQKATTEYNGVFKKYKKKYPIFDDWIHSVTHDPLLGKIKIVEIGQNQNTGNSVVPSEWIDKEFENARQLHKEMDELDTRIGKPPVTFAVIYSMTIQKNDTIIKNIKDEKYDKIFYIDLVGNKFDSNMTTKMRKGYQYVKYKNILVGFVLNDILEPKGNIEGEHTQSKIKEVGLLVSRLQKSIRRGRNGSKALIETIDALNVSPNYNLPEHGFLRVSASKQLVWRLFITILEDCRPYQPIDEPSLLDLLLLVLITQKVQEYKFTKPVLDAIKLLALLAQYNDTPGDWYDWRSLPKAEDTPLKENSDFHNAISLAINNIIMMPGDNKMLRQYYSDKVNIYEPFMVPDDLESKVWKKTVSIKKYLHHIQSVYDDIVLSSFDPHSKTYIILYYQACIPISMTTKQISGYIWDQSSSYNIRSGKPHPKIDEVLRSIQKYFLQESLNLKNGNSDKTIDKEPSQQKITKIKNITPNDNAKRTSFLILFGRKYKYGGKDVILSGTKDMPARVKIENEWTNYYDKSLLNAYPEKTINLNDIDPPFGFKWKKTKVTTQIVDGKPMVNNKYIPYFDGSSMIESATPNVDNKINKMHYQIIIQILSGLDISFETLLGFREKKQKEIVDWLPKSTDIKKLNMELIKLAYTKIFNQFNNIIMVGPVSRSGHKMQNSINYMLEGKLWAVFNLFTFLYPDTFKPNGAVNFFIKKETPGYVHLIQTLEKILFDNNIINGPVPSIKTELWDHQKDSVNKIISGFRNGKFGFGDASDVGAGKTLTSIKIAADLIKENNKTYSGILVLLPGNKLLKTWKDELEKHTEGFDIIFQKNNADIGSIKRNTIVITTMGKMRDHPINHKWLLLIIDECLTVQNRNALWTESAWKQSMMSKHLVMMSATFFRTRFDKLYYMLKMLRTGLPEKREYLDTILSESIVSQVSKVKRKWTSKFNYFELDVQSRKQYDAINRSDLSLELKFAKLSSLLVSSSKTNSIVTEQLAALVKKLEKNKQRCLIYARAADEAKLWSDKLNIPIYPTKGTHCIVTYNDGTYGLNDLVIYNTIIMRPPPPDKLPQIKGRLDRPGQKTDDLYIEYFVLKDTIEEGLILRLNIASQFLQKYIMPLAKFYDVSVNYKKYQEENKTDK